MKLLFADLVYDYNSRDFGLGYGYYNTHLAFANMKELEYIHFDVCDFGDIKKRESNNRALVDIVEKEKPDMFFYASFDDLLYEETLLHIKNKTKTTSVHWFCDDQWRFEDFSRRYCWNFDYSVTTDHAAVEKYKAIGYENVILSQWAANQHVYKRMGLPFRYDVSFVGQPHGVRRALVADMRKRGLDVATFGNGWKLNWLTRKWNRAAGKAGLERLKFDSGMIGHCEMLKVFNQSKINLNLANNSTGVDRQMKGRNFEVPACGGFLLTSYAAGLDEYYEIGKEVEAFHSTDEMIDKAKYYLAHDAQRQKIADAGYERTLRDHTWDKRFREIFAKLKLKS